MPSPNNNLISAFSPYTDSPSSPAPFKSPLRSSGSSDNSNFLHPPVHSPLVSSPSDIADPSPIAPSSNGTEFDEIETGLDTEDVGRTEQPQDPPRRDLDTTPSLKQGEPELKLDTKYAAASSLRPRSDEDEQPTSVIHAPQGFEAFVSILHTRRSPPSIRRSTPTPSQRSDITAVNPPMTEENDIASQKRTRSPASPPPITTTVPPARDWSATPRAQTRPEAEAETAEEKSKLQRASSLEGKHISSEPI
ncbi:MAG: hypothetical protein Q9220_005237 [cf. Caloplaca sp. 1 TL-2023]